MSESLKRLLDSNEEAAVPTRIFTLPNRRKRPSDSTEEAVVPTRIDIRLPFAPESEELLLLANEAPKERPATNLSSPFVVAPGTVIGEYVIEKKIGQGGMGEIWRGLQPVIGKQVAVKILRGKIAADQDAVERFLREAKAVNAINHKALTDIFSFGDLPDGRPYFVMEYLTGQSLLSYIATKGPLPWSEILEIFVQLCEALEATHQQGIIHRDLKSENLFLVREPNQPFLVKVLDFGLAKLVNPEQENAQLTQDGMVFGTAAYMAPEQCKGQATYLSDIYSLGIILFETITGRTPFAEPGMRSTEVMMRQVGEPAPAPSSLVSGRVVPVEVDALVLRLLSKIPAERPASCGALASSLEEVLVPLAKEETPQATKSAKPVFLSESKRQSVPAAKRTPWGFVAVGAGVLLAASALYQAIRPAASVPASIPALVQVKEVIRPAAASTPSHPEKVRVKITSFPTKASVFLGETLLGETPLDQEILYSDKEFVLSINKEGFQASARSFVPNVGLELQTSLQRNGPKGKTKPKNPSASTNETQAPTEEDEPIVDPFQSAPNPPATPK